MSRLFSDLSPADHAVQERSRHLQPLQAQGPVLPHVQGDRHRYKVVHKTLTGAQVLGTF